MGPRPSAPLASIGEDQRTTSRNSPLQVRAVAPIVAPRRAGTALPRNRDACDAIRYLRSSLGEMTPLMIIYHVYVMIFAVAMMACVLATPIVREVATYIGAIDRPDQFRRIHKGAIPRLGGLALALGVAAATILTHLN